MRGFSPMGAGPVFGNSVLSSPPRPRPLHANSMTSPPRFHSTLLSSSPPRPHAATLMPRGGGTASDKLRQEKDMLLMELENVRRLYHGLKVQYETMKMDHNAANEDYNKLRSEVQGLRMQQAELGWDNGQLILENKGFKKMKGEIVEEDIVQARSYEEMSRELEHLKQKLKEVDLNDKRRRNDAHIMELEASLRHVQSGVDYMYNPDGRISRDSLLDGNRSRIGFLDRPPVSLLNPRLEPSVLSPRGNLLGPMGDISRVSYLNSTVEDARRIRGEPFMSPRRETHTLPTRISPLKNPLSDPNFGVDRSREVLHTSLPTGPIGRILSSPPPAHIERSVHYDDTRLSMRPTQPIQPIQRIQPIQPAVFSETPIFPVVGGPIGVRDSVIVPKEPSIFERPFAFPDKYSKLGMNHHP